MNLQIWVFVDILAPLQIYVFEYLLLSLKYRKDYGRLEQINFNFNDLNINLLFFKNSYICLKPNKPSIGSTGNKGVGIT